DHLKQSIQIDPDRPEVDYAFGQALVDAGRPAEAIPHLQNALRAGVRVDLAGYDLARALAATGNRAGALQILQTVKPDHPKDADTGRTADARAHAQEALRIKPDYAKARQFLNALPRR